MKIIDANAFVNTLKDFYPEATCSLDFTTPFEMLVAVMLSAQCTDNRVNIVTKDLFKRCPTLSNYIDIDIDELESIIKPCGFFKTKAKNIKLCANIITDTYKGDVPAVAKDLESLPGIGRKSTNVILLEVFDIAQGIAIDTHAKRISNLVGLSSSSNPDIIEKDLLNIFENKHLKDINHLFMWHGRNCCVARKPNCNYCPIKQYCDFSAKKSN